MPYPRRYYKRTKTGKVLKFAEKDIKSCRWCGTMFVVDTQKDFCSKWCITVSDAYGDVVLIRKD